MNCRGTSTEHTFALRDRLVTLSSGSCSVCHSIPSNTSRHLPASKCSTCSSSDPSGHITFSISFSPPPVPSSIPCENHQGRLCPWQAKDKPVMKLPLNTTSLGGEAKRKILRNGCEHNSACNGNDTSREHRKSADSDKRNSKCDINGVTATSNGNGTALVASENSCSDKSVLNYALGANKNGVADDSFNSNKENNKIETINNNSKVEDQSTKIPNPSAAVNGNHHQSSLESPVCNGEASSQAPHKLSLKEWSAKGRPSGEVLCNSPKGVYTKAQRDILLKNGHVAANHSEKTNEAMNTERVGDGTDSKETPSNGYDGNKEPVVTDEKEEPKAKPLNGLSDIDTAAASAIPRLESDYSPIWKYSSRVARAHNHSKKEAIYETVYPTEYCGDAEEENACAMPKEEENPPPLPPRTKSLGKNAFHKPLERCMALPLYSHKQPLQEAALNETSAKNSDGQHDFEDEARHPARKVNRLSREGLKYHPKALNKSINYGGEPHLKHKPSCSKNKLLDGAGGAKNADSAVSRTSSGGDSVQSEPSVRPKQPLELHLAVNRGESLPYSDGPSDVCEEVNGSTSSLGSSISTGCLDNKFESMPDSCPSRPSSACSDDFPVCLCPVNNSVPLSDWEGPGEKDCDHLSEVTEQAISLFSDSKKRSSCGCCFCNSHVLGAPMCPQVACGCHARKCAIHFVSPFSQCTKCKGLPSNFKSDVTNANDLSDDNNTASTTLCLNAVKSLTKSPSPRLSDSSPRDSPRHASNSSHRLSDSSHRLSDSSHPPSDSGCAADSADNDMRGGSESTTAMVTSLASSTSSSVFESPSVENRNLELPSFSDASLLANILAEAIPISPSESNPSLNHPAGEPLGRADNICQEKDAKEPPPAIPPHKPNQRSLHDLVHRLNRDEPPNPPVDGKPLPPERTTSSHLLTKEEATSSPTGGNEEPSETYLRLSQKGIVKHLPSCPGELRALHFVLMQ